jgi:hypothetical protein
VHVLPREKLPPDSADQRKRISAIFWGHLIPTSVWVRWTMTASARTKDTTTFSCTVETEMAAWIRFAAAASAFGYFLRKHVDEEALGFAADITRKLPARAPRQ